MRTCLTIFLGLGLLALGACGSDDPAPAASAGRGGTAGSSGQPGGGSSQGGKPGAGMGGSSAGTSQAGTSNGGSGNAAGSGPACLVNPPPLPACDSAQGCLGCLCTTCDDAWNACLADEGCRNAVACVVAGCSASQCATLTSGETSLALAEAVDSCRVSKAQCRDSCTGSGTGGAAGQGGSGTSGQAGTAAQAGSAGQPAGGSAGAGGSKPVTTQTCCQTSDQPGCEGLPYAQLTADQKSVENCVCAKDEFCCLNSWDEECLKDIPKYNCGPACPAGTGGSGGASGAGGGAGKAGAGGSGGQGGKSCSPSCAGDKVCDPSTGECEECLTSAQCVDNRYGPNCLGTSGVTSLICGCSSNFDCKKHPSGTYCDSFANFCGCQSDQDCFESPQGMKCTPVEDAQKGNIKQCGCTTTQDCPSGSTCILSLGVCGQ